MINRAYYYIYDIEVPEERRRENEIIEFQVEQIKAYQRKVARLEEENETQNRSNTCTACRFFFDGAGFG